MPKTAILTVMFAAAALPFWAQEILPSDEDVAGKITETEMQRLATLHDYSVIRKYVLHNSHLKSDAVMTVRLKYQKGCGKSFEIIGVENADGMSRRVLDRLLQSEAESSHKESQDQFAISKVNYKFHVTGTDTRDGRSCYIVDLIPKHKSRYLVQGKAWVDKNEFALVRIEARPSVSLSFWVGKPYIVQDFQKVGSFWFAAHNRSESESWVLGSSVLTIDYSDYKVTPEIRVALNHPTP